MRQVPRPHHNHNNQQQQQQQPTQQPTTTNNQKHTTHNTPHITHTQHTHNTTHTHNTQQQQQQQPTTTTTTTTNNNNNQQHTTTHNTQQHTTPQHHHNATTKHRCSSWELSICPSLCNDRRRGPASASSSGAPQLQRVGSRGGGSWVRKAVCSCFQAGCRELITQVTGSIGISDCCACTVMLSWTYTHLS